MGILFALIALLSWGVGDFLIQKSARKFGDWMALFFITGFASIALLPFVFKEFDVLTSLSPWALVVMVFSGLVMTVAAYFDFEALRVGKISIVEPIYAFEIPVSALFASAFIQEHLTWLQGSLIVLLLIGIYMVSVKSLYQSKFKRVLEKGVVLAVIATLLMGAANFVFGYGARLGSPILVNWFTSLIIALISFVYLVKNSQVKLVIAEIKNHTGLILGVGIADTLAWVAYAYGMLYLPIAVVTSISEGYIALAALLGLVITKEKIVFHQKFGIVVTVVAASLLAYTVG